MKFCNKCGSEIEDDINICPSCGIPTQLSAPPIGSETPATNVTIPTQKITSKNRIINILLIASLVIIFAFLLYNSSTDSPKYALEKFITAINNEDINKAMSCVDPTYEKLYTASNKAMADFFGTPDLSAITDLFPRLLNLTEYNSDFQITINKVISEDIKDDTATIIALVTVNVRDSKGKVSNNDVETTFTLKKFDNGWRIIDIH
ncbi:hypothetical protein CPJCM30710_31310 [Clostridium polyendosporum]|uniref:Zinc-ribbon domain-containing protein n=1 Tax=Clostridium polyendosporum TaxID=69208 RepID=A0A919VHJ7_9CLOT|nr:zinc-ribbon domain-containing protein [Clostridium polyendosporum]GIM30465.1 hypothetical protein CPJCM30710_31310 [Clostridium polyendosporum]